jgi:predicted membrane protein
MTTYVMLCIDAIILITTIVAVFIFPYFFGGTEFYMAHFYKFFFIDVSVMAGAIIAPIIMMCLK